MDDHRLEYKNTNLEVYDLSLFWWKVKPALERRRITGQYRWGVSLEKPSSFDISNHKAREGEQVSVSRDTPCGVSVQIHMWYGLVNEGGEKVDERTLTRLRTTTALGSSSRDDSACGNDGSSLRLTTKMS